MTVSLEQEKVKTTWIIPKSLLRQLKHYATDDDLTVAQLVIKICQEYAVRREAKK